MPLLEPSSLGASQGLCLQEAGVGNLELHPSTSAWEADILNTGEVPAVSNVGFKYLVETESQQLHVLRAEFRFKMIAEKPSRKSPFERQVVGNGRSEFRSSEQLT